MKALLLSLLSFFPNFCHAGTGENAKHVILISMDGAAPYVIENSNMPTLKRMAKEGSYSWNAQTILPSITLPSHTSMVTGVGPEVHGILWNDWIPENGLVKVATIFSVAHRQGLKTSLIASKAKFKHLNIPGTIDHFELVERNADKVAERAAEVFRKEKPNVMMVHFRDADAAGHYIGWNSPQQKEALALVDSSIAKILNSVERTGLLKETVILVSADHGGHARTHGSNMKEDTTIPWVAYGAGATQGLINQEIRTIDTAATALWLLGVPTPKGFQGKPVLPAFNF